MAFTLSGTTITQSGTDTSLAGLSGIGGVTTQVVGGRTIYRIATNTLVIAGNLTFDARTQGLEMTGATVSPVFQVNSGGVLTMNSLLNSKPSYEEAIVIRPANNTVQTEFQINTGATFNLNGAKIVTAGTGSSRYQSYIFYKGATINITDGWIKSFINQQRWGESGSGSLANFNINRLISETAGFTIFGNFGNLQGLAPLNCVVQIVGTANFVIKDFSPIDSTSLIDNWNNTNLYVDNAISSIVPLTGGDANSMPTKWTTMRKSVVVQTLSPTNTGITGAVSYIRDTNNGSRLNVANIPNQLNDNVYVQTTNGSGLTPTFQVYVLHGKANTGVAQPVIRDYRTKTTVPGQDFFDIHTWAYGYQYKGLPDTALKGIGTLTVTSVMLTDTNVTLSETNAVAKLASSFSVNTGTNTITVTANSTLDDLYDAMKAYKTRNVQAQLEYPTIATQPVNASGDTLVTAMSVVGIEFLTAGTKFKKLQAPCTANGTISNLSIIGNVYQPIPSNLINVNISGTLEYDTGDNYSVNYYNSKVNIATNSSDGIITISPDATSSITDYTNIFINYLDSKINFTGVDSITFYPTSTDANAGTNAGVTITTNPYVFKFGSVISGVTMSGTVNIRYVIGGKVTIGTLNISPGLNSFALTDNELLSTITAKLDQTNTNLSKVNRNVIKASKLIPANEQINN